MRAPRILRTLAFRIVLVYVVIFALSAAALVAFTYWNARRALNEETDQTIEAEIVGLSEQYQRSGIAGLTDVIMGRSQRGGFGLYLLTDTLKRPLAGNLDAWPQIRAHAGDFVEFDYVRRVGSGTEQHRARGRVFELADGFQLLVARDVDERYKTLRLFTTALPWTVALMLLLGLVGGALMSRNLLARLDAINRTSREIMAGDLTRRLPLTRASDEIDRLSDNLNRMLERTERLMKGMRTVTDSIAHDLRTPLNRLRNRLEGVVNSHIGEEESREEVEAAVGETDTLISTFNALLLIAEAEAGVVREAMGPVSLPSVVEGIAELYAPVAEEKSISLDVAPSGAVRIEGNQTLISQALANLIDNAIKYTPAGGRVKVAVEDTAGGVVLSVTDNGPGIAAADRARVVERFVRLETSRNSPGTGLGLSLVAAVARLHDARFELSDNKPGLKAALIFARRPVRRLAAPA
ncbi:MAG TPA: HAMP domain-containing sensor histidine kinase [Rhizomicrobium sp.]|nr:HAMP domain-containing sensor histidine kinase [Rhizomicrobium sp.]